MTNQGIASGPPVRRLLGSVTAAWLITLPCAGCRTAPTGAAARFRHLATTAPETRRFDPADPMQRRAASDPLGFLKMCRRHYLENVRDYRCRFIMQERLNGTLGKVEEMKVRFREQPFSVDMRWVRNAIQASRVSYVAGRWARGGREYALIELSGLLALLAPNGVRRDIHAPEMVAAARRTIDHFGFKNTLDSIIENCERAEGEPGYDLRYVGLADLDQRPCFLFRRVLPADDATQRHVDRLLLIYIDREWFLPTGCFGYADEQGQKLMGAYITTDVQLNPGLTDADF